MENNNSASEKKLNWREACAILGCKKSHFYNLINSGRIPAQRHGSLRGVWVYEKDCLNYLRSCQENFQFNS